jgi:hypothetical protein
MIILLLGLVSASFEISIKRWNTLVENIESDLRLALGNGENDEML